MKAGDRVSVRVRVTRHEQTEYVCRTWTEEVWMDGMYVRDVHRMSDYYGPSVEVLLDQVPPKSDPPPSRNIPWYMLDEDDDDSTDEQRRTVVVSMYDMVMPNLPALSGTVIVSCSNPSHVRRVSKSLCDGCHAVSVYDDQ